MIKKKKFIFHKISIVLLFQVGKKMAIVLFN